MTNSPLSLSQWENLETLATNASEALQALSIQLLIDSESVDEATAKKMRIQSQIAKDAWDKLLGGYWYHPQGEWLGGDSFKTVEPHISSNRLTVVSES